MAFAANTAWEVRATGSDANGGSFNAGATGTDFSQQDSPQIAFTDLVIGTTTTQLTSVANPFGATSVGNMINITGGTGFTIQRVQIVSVSGITATCDKACGTAASLGGTGNLGGGLVTPQLASTLAVTANAIWIKSGTYNLTATITFSVSESLTYTGYNTTHGDNGTAPVLNVTANGINLFTIPAIDAGGLLFQNISFTTTATTKASCIITTSSTLRLSFFNCSISGGFTMGIAATAVDTLTIINTSIVGCTSYGVDYAAQSIDDSLIIDGCYFYGNAGGLTAQIHSSSTVICNIYIANSIISGGGSYGIDISATGYRLTVNRCTIADNVRSGINIGGGWTTAATFGTVYLRSNIIYGNGAFGVAAASARIVGLFIAQNALGANTSGSYQNFPAGAGDVALTANPFNGTTDFSLNNTSGGGASVKGLGYPGLWAGGTTTGYPDIGAVQSLGSGGTVQNYGYTG